MLNLILSLILALMPISHTQETKVEESKVATHVAQEVEYTDWTTAVLSGAGVSLPANAEVILADIASCGPSQPEPYIGGCTYPMEDGSSLIVVSPELEGTDWGIHILLHEVGHAYGFDNECDAEAYAHNWSDKNIWAYKECNVSPAA